MKPEFEQLFVEALPKLKQSINKRRMSIEDKEDLFQETCLKALIGEDTFNLSEPMMPWLMTIAKNIYNYKFRQPWERLVHGVGDIDEFATKTPSPEKHMIVSDFLEDVSRLPAKQAKVLHAKAMGDCDKDIAHSLNTTVQAVKMNAHYARTIIREIHKDLYKELTS